MESIRLLDEVPVEEMAGYAFADSRTASISEKWARDVSALVAFWDKRFGDAACPTGAQIVLEWVTSSARGKLHCRDASSMVHRRGAAVRWRFDRVRGAAGPAPGSSGAAAHGLAAATVILVNLGDALGTEERILRRG